jgi:predicted phage terminase large subunit-like protein
LDDPLHRKIGEFIWPEWFPPGHFEPFKRNARTWSALFQQRPSPETGDYFRAEWLKPYYTIPDRETLRVYGASDYAVTKGRGDYTVHVIVGVDPEGKLYLLDLWRKQSAPDEWVEAFCDLVAQWRPMGWAEESGQIKSGVGPFLHKRLMERELYVVRASFPSRADKAIRAQSIRGRMSMNGLYVPPNAPWYPDFRSELLVFDNGNNDDQVDAMSLIGQVLDRMMPGDKAKPPKPPPKIFSTDPATCTVTMNDMWEANSGRKGKGYLRIH